MKDKERSAPKASIFGDIRVIDFSHALAGPTCTMHMADMGAEVIKVEPPVTGDHTRIQVAGIKNGVSALFMWRNRGKKSISLDMKHPKGLEIFKDLVRVSDVVVQNLRVGVMDRLGLSYEELKKINPKVILCSISGYGQNGPLADYPANDHNIQAMSGAMAITGHADGPPLPCWVSWVDSATAAHAFAAVTAALYHRDKTGIGQHLDIAMMDVAFTHHDYPILEYLWSDGQVHRTRQGPMHPTVALQGVFECQDGYFVASANTDDAWRQLTELMGRPELQTDPRFDTRPHRYENKAEAERIVMDWVKNFNMEDARILLQENGVVATPVLSIAELLNHPQIEAREMLVEVEDPRVGKVKLPNSPFKFSETKPNTRRRAPLLGEHNEEVLVGLLGYGKERVEQLQEEGVVYPCTN